MFPENQVVHRQNNGTKVYEVTLSDLSDFLDLSDLNLPLLSFA